MTITLLQTDISWMEADVNIQHATSAIEASPRSDLYVLPEMWATGFVTNPTDETHNQSMRALEWMVSESKQTDCRIAGSLAVKEEREGEEDVWRNRFFLASPDGNVEYYDKHHLFTYGGEDIHYSPGTDRTIIMTDEASILPQICYDLRFPVFSRNGKGEERYDIIIYVASWPASRQAAWDVLLRARAIENQCFVVGVNRAGKDPICSYAGGSCIIDPYGRNVISLNASGHVQTATAEVDMKMLARFRNKFPVLEDADIFGLKPNI